MAADTAPAYFLLYLFTCRLLEDTRRRKDNRRRGAWGTASSCHAKSGGLVSLSCHAPPRFHTRQRLLASLSTICTHREMAVIASVSVSVYFSYFFFLALGERNLPRSLRFPRSSPPSPEPVRLAPGIGGGGGRIPVAFGAGGAAARPGGPGAGGGLGARGGGTAVLEPMGMLVGMSSKSNLSLLEAFFAPARWSRTRFFCDPPASGVGFLMVNLPLFGMLPIMSEIESPPLGAAGGG